MKCNAHFFLLKKGLGLGPVHYSVS